MHLILYITISKYAIYDNNSTNAAIGVSARNYQNIKMKSHEYEYKSYIKYKGYKYINMKILYTINWI